MANNTLETIIGAAVLALAGGFLYFAYNQSDVKKTDGYLVTAAFSNINGITAGSTVRVGGIKIGVVETLELDHKNYKAIAKLRVDTAVKLPKDSSASVQSSGLLGEKFLAIEPGGEDSDLKNGDRIAYTQPSVSLEEMIGKFVFSGGGADKNSKPSSETTQENPESSPDLQTP